MATKANKGKTMAAVLRTKREQKQKVQHSIPVKLRMLTHAVASEAVNQHEMIEALMLGIVSGHHVLFIGPPGCNKTGLIDSIIKRIDHARLFMTTMNKFAEPDILLGPISIAGLKADKLVRNHKGYLPDADFAFIGEIFSGNSSTLPVLNRVLNERQIEEEGKRINLPLRSVFADTNCFPQQQLAAVYDRFLIRQSVGYLGTNDHDAFACMMTLPAPDKDPSKIITLQNVHDAYAESQCVDVKGAIIRELFEIRIKLHAEQVQISDRRWKHSLDVIKASAYLDRRSTVHERDLYSLRHVLWSNPTDIKKMYDVIDQYKGTVIAAGEEEAMKQAIKLFLDAACSQDISNLMDASTSLKQIAERFTGTANKVIESLEDKLVSLVEDDSRLSESDAKKFVTEQVRLSKQAASIVS